MKIISKSELGTVIIQPTIFDDGRGYFYESFNDEWFRKNVADITFIQDNQSMSAKYVVRGMHWQNPPYAQAKLVRVVKGTVIDFAVDIRKGSPTYGKYAYAILSDETHYQFYIPEGFAHGFIALDDNTIFQYKVNNVYNKESEGSFNVNDKQVNLPINKFVGAFIVVRSNKDIDAPELAKANNKFEYND